LAQPAIEQRRTEMNAIAESKDPSRQKLATDLKTVVTDAEN